MPTVDAILDAFARQSKYCRLRDAPLTASIIDGAALDIKDGGPLRDLVNNFDEDPGKGALALRIAGAAHYLFIKGCAGPLSACYEVPESIDASAARNGLVTLVNEYGSVFRKYISNPPQTNEINRIAALLPALSKVAQRFGMPLDLFELGASGGLLLTPDRCRVDYGSFEWGDGDIALRSEWRGEPPDLSPALNICRRLGCDRSPMDYFDPEQLDIAHSYIWPEHPQRRVLFDAAVKGARGTGVRVERADALEWLKTRALPQEGAVSVVFTSVFAVYLSDEERAELQRITETFGAQASEAAPLAFIQFEPWQALDFIEFTVDLTIWPGGAKERVATAHAHGQWVQAPTA